MVRSLDCWDDLQTVQILSVAITTQKPVSGISDTGFLDLEFAVTVLGPDGEPTLRVIWVEVKHGAELHGTQIDTYREAAEGEPGSPQVILLVPRSSAVAASEVFRQDWEQFSANLKKESRGVEDPVSRWMLNQYFTFLKEEQLMEEDRISLESAYAMQQAPQADSATSAVVRRAIEHVENDWGKRVGGSKFYGLGSFHHFEWSRSKPGYTMLELMVKPDTSSLEPSGGQVFFAGLTFAKRSNPFPEEADAALLAPGFELFDSEGWGRRMRLLRPEALLQFEDPAGQSKMLADWATESFRSIHAAFRQA